MAGAHSATLSIFAPPTNPTPRIRLKPVLSSYIPTPFPSMLTKRKNHLRPKILKTTKPFPTTPPVPQQPQTNVIIPITSPKTPTQDDPVFESLSDEISSESCPAIAGEADKVEEFHASAASSITGECSGILGNFSAKSVLKYGLYLVGIFVFQTICAVWVLGNANSDKKDGNLTNLDAGNDIRNKNKLLLNGNGKVYGGKFGSKTSNVIYLDDFELDEKIKEIRVMAREARKIEEKKLKDGEGDDDTVNESADSKGRIGVEKEIGARLVMLEKRLNSNREKLPGSYTNYLGQTGNVEDGSEVKKTLMFKKKHKFRSPSMNVRNNVKGFPGFEDGSVSKHKKSDLVSIDNSMGRSETAGDDLRESISRAMEIGSGKKAVNTKLNSLQNDGKKFGKVQREMEVMDTDSKFGALHETSRGNLLVVDTNLRKSRDLQTQNSPNFAKEIQEASAKSDEPAASSRNGSSRDREVGNKPPAIKVGGKQSDIKTDLWWLNLPYVIAIFMRRGSDHEGAGGLYTLRITSKPQDQSDSSYPVAFEDLSDANNFCYLLESFFEDLGDFNAEIVLLSIKELLEAAELHFKKVIVVKKGQLKLYAGQPFADVEMALHSLVGQN